MTDLYTIRTKKGRFHDLTIGLCGDLKYGRTVHSLIHAMCRYENIHFVLISPEELKVPDYVIREIEAVPGCSYTLNPDLDDAIRQVDILYMTRIQRERFASQEEYLRAERQLHSGRAKNAECQRRYDRPAPDAHRQRDHRRGGRGSQGLLFCTGAVWHVCCAWR